MGTYIIIVLESFLSIRKDTKKTNTQRILRKIERYYLRHVYEPSFL